MKPCACVRLAKLAEKGLACGPRCNAAERWRLSQAGQELAAGGQLLIDERDREVLVAAARAVMMNMLF